MSKRGQKSVISMPPPFLVVAARHEYRRIGDILLFDPLGSDELDRKAPRAVGSRIAAEEGAECRISVEAREAAPDDCGSGIDQRADCAVTDERQVE